MLASILSYLSPSRRTPAQPPGSVLQAQGMINGFWRPDWRGSMQCVFICNTLNKCLQMITERECVCVCVCVCVLMPLVISSMASITFVKGCYVKHK